MSTFGLVAPQPQQQRGSGQQSIVPSFSHPGRVSSATTTGGVKIAADLDRLPFLNLYDSKNISAASSVYSIHDLERLMIRRMTILHTIQEQFEALQRQTLDIKKLLGFATDRQAAEPGEDRRPEDADVNPLLQLTPSEDLVSHLLCRLVFCKDPKWTEWFVRTERFLFRAKLDLIWRRSATASGKAELRDALLSRSWIQAEEVLVPVRHHPDYEYHKAVGTVTEQTDDATMLMPARASTGAASAAATSNNNMTTTLDAAEDADEVRERNGKLLKWLYGCAGKSDANFGADQLKHHVAENRVHRFYSVSFTVVKDLVRRRAVFVHKGRAWVQEPHFIEFVAASFADHIRIATLRERPRRQALLDAAVDSNSAEFNQFAAADAAASPLARLVTLMDGIFARYVADPVCEIKVAEEGSLTLDHLKAHAEVHFPPCMVAMDDTLRRDGHLKHHGRWQYGLFLKTIGLSLQDSLRHFATTMTLKGGNGSQEAFNKSTYGYGIRHMYGKEGKHTDYSALSCVSMVNSPAPSGGDKFDCHGCPFRNNDEGGLRRMLASKQRRISLQQPANKKAQQQEAGGAGNNSFAVGGLAPLPAGDIESIVDDAKGSHYTRACRRFFTSVHAGHQGDGQLFRSPAEYYRASTQLYRRAAEEAQKASTTAGESPGERRSAEAPVMPGAASSAVGSETPTSAAAPAVPQRIGEPTRTRFNAMPVDNHE